MYADICTDLTINLCEIMCVTNIMILSVNYFAYECTWVTFFLFIFNYILNHNPLKEKRYCWSFLLMYCPESRSECLRLINNYYVVITSLHCRLQWITNSHTDLHFFKSATNCNFHSFIQTRCFSVYIKRDKSAYIKSIQTHSELTKDKTVTYTWRTYETLYCFIFSHTQ